MKKTIIAWIAKVICKKIWKEYQGQLKIKQTQIENLKKKNQLLQMDVNAYNNKFKYFN